MAQSGQEVLKCAYPGCEKEPRPGEAGAAAEPRYCGLPDPVTGEPHTALTAFRRRQMLAPHGGGVAGSQDLGRPGIAVWRYRRAGAQRRHQAEADAGEARLAALQADAQLTEALAAKTAAEQETAAAQARAAQDQRAAEERVAGAQQERDEADRRAGQAESRARNAEQDAARAREAAESARAELDRARQAADRQVQARAEHVEAELQRARADRDQAAGQAAPGQPGGATRRRRSRGGPT